jgi:hypothetical protein
MAWRRLLPARVLNSAALPVRFNGTGRAPAQTGRPAGPAHGLPDSTAHRSKRFSNAQPKKAARKLRTQVDASNSQLNWAFANGEHQLRELLRADIAIATMVESVRL